MIHPSAIVSNKAKLASDAEIGPFSIIGDNVSIAKGVKIASSCVISGNTIIGEGCEVYTGAVLGSRPQDLKYKDENNYLKIGKNNIVREYCTFNPGTGKDGKTIVGDNNLFMAYSHVAHDCLVGNNCIFANNATLAGHVTVEDKAVIGGLSAIHQFTRVGSLAIIGGCSKVVQDIPPYSTCDGHPACIYGLNLVGLRRHGINSGAIKELERAFKILFNAGLSRSHALERVEQELQISPEISYLIAFIKDSKRGVAHGRRHRQSPVNSPA